MSDIVKEEQRYQEENAHTEVVTVTTASKNLEDILAELKPTIEYDDGSPPAHFRSIIALSKRRQPAISAVPIL